VQKKDIVSVATHLRYTTLIELPEAEQIVQEFCGDKDLWAINDQRNFVFIKPLGEKPGRDTNLYVTTASGNIYSFVLREVSNDPKTRADIKITIQQGDQDSIVAMKGAPKFVPASTVAALEAQVAEQQKELAKAKVSIKPEALVHDYVWDRNSKAADRFGIRDISHDNVFTYIDADTQEAPSLYEFVDNKPTILQYTLKNGVYTVPKVLDAGELRMGKLKADFHREKGQS
jgi:hypothetical protein